ncbi:MAG: hypothetical protein LBQ15_10330 [Clostridium sp.]|nr:hypothetical protein [Clostridium sp.]
MKGYFTVEAALILPLVLWVYLFLINLMIYQYDRCLLEQDTGVVALRGTLLETADKGQMLQDIQKEIDGIYQDKYVLFRPSPMKIQLQHEKVLVSAEGRFQPLLPFLLPEDRQGEKAAGTPMDIRQGERWAAEAAYENNTISPMFFIRTYRKLMNRKGA